MPRDVFYDGGVTLVERQRLHDGVAFGILHDVPMCNGGVFGSGEDVALFGCRGVPGHAVALFGLTSEGDVGPAFGVAGLGLAGMFRAVKDVDLTGDGLGSNEVGVLRHVASAIDFAAMVDGLCDFDARSDIAVRADF